MAKYWGTPPFFTQNFFFQNDSEWLEMDFKHNFSQCNILTRMSKCLFSYKPIVGECYSLVKHPQLSGGGESNRIKLPSTIITSDLGTALVTHSQRKIDFFEIQESQIAQAFAT